jgi:YVTN family beta-propeller protein
MEKQMQKFASYIFVLLLVASIAACGGDGTATTAATPIYVTLPGTLAAANTLMGGAVQGGAISAKFENYSVSTYAGISGTSGGADTSPTTTATFNRPMDITTDGTNLYVADYLNNSIRKITSSREVTTLQYTDADGNSVVFNRPTGITTDGTSLFVVNSGSNSISFIHIATEKVTTIIGSETGLAGSVDSATPADVRFNQPIGITTDGVNLYVTDAGNHTIRQINITTKAVTTVAGTSGAIGSTNGVQGIARFNLPWRITTDRTSLYVTDFSNRTIRKIDIVSGDVTKLAGASGSLGLDSGSTDGTGDAARFNQPNGITTDGTYVYVTDSYQNTIRRIEISAPNTVTTIAGIPKNADDETLGAGGSVDSPGTPSFYTPIGITTDGANLYVADSYNNTIRKIH